MLKTNTKHCHVMIADTAKSMAHELYETMMSDNEWYSIWKNKYPGLNPAALEEKFVAKNWPKLIEQSRATLASLLSQPIDPVLKDQIHDALVKDNTLVRGRKQPPIFQMH